MLAENTERKLFEGAVPIEVELERNPANGGLESYNKPELVELAASIGVEGRTNMTKDELVAAIAKASRTR